MTFLAPISGIIAGVLGLGVLGTLYLLKLRRRTLRVGSTLLWQEAASDLQVNVPFRWLRASWLLLLHTLLVLLIAIALARPTAELSGPGADHLYIIIDRSASMNAPPGDNPGGDPDGPTRLDTAIQRAIDLVNTLRGTPVVSIITLDARPALTTPPTNLTAPTRRALRAITPTDQPADLGAALELIAGLNAGSRQIESPTSSPETDRDERTIPVVLFTDANLLEPRTVAFPGLRLAIERVDDPAAPPALNLAIADIAVSRDLDDPRIARVFLRLVSTAPREITTALRVSANGSPRTIEPVRIPGSSESAVGETTHTVRIDEPGTPIITVHIDRDDALAADNTASVRLPPSVSPGILVLAPRGPDGRPAPNPDLLDVLTALEPERLTLLDDPAQATAAARSGLYALAVLDRLAPAEVMSIPSIAIATLPWAGTLEPASAGLSTTATTVLAWERAHPALRFVALDGFAIDRPLALPQDARSISVPGVSASARVREIATGRDAPLIAELSIATTRHMVIGFDLAQSTWPVHYSFPITIASAIEWLLNASSSEDPTNTGTDRVSTKDAVTLTGALAKAALADQGLTGPVDIMLPASAMSDEDLTAMDSITLPPFPRAGLYTAGRMNDSNAEGTGPSDPSQSNPGVFDPDRTLAVNLTDAFESSLSPAWTPDSATIVDGAAGLHGRAEIWHWFVLGALPLLIAEWLAYARQSILR